MDYYNITLSFEQDEILAKDQDLGIESVLQETEEYSKGFRMGRSNQIPEKTHFGQYWRGYCDGLRKYWTEVLEVEVEEEF